MNNPSGQTILVVEDEALIRLDISDTLRDRGYRVIEAANADDALRMLAEDMHIDLVFTDVRMPGKFDGFDIARSAATHDVPVILTSGHVYADEIPQDMRPLIAKPYSRADVLREIERKLRRDR